MSGFVLVAMASAVGASLLISALGAVMQARAAGDSVRRTAGIRLSTIGIGPALIAMSGAVVVLTYREIGTTAIVLGLIIAGLGLGTVLLALRHTGGH